jgi:predicted MPP superfamily phosphohydrolase
MNLEFQVFSDIHLEFNKNPNSYPKIEPLSPYIFLAGDIGKINNLAWENFIKYCSKNWLQVFYVLGNHEFYHSRLTMDKLNESYKIFLSKFSNVHLLDNNSIDIQNTDFQVYGFTAWTPINFSSRSQAQCVINDYSNILYIKEDSHIKDYITPVYINELSQNQINKFIEFITKTTKQTIILTHFPPIKLGTSDPKYLTENSDFINQYFSWNNLIEDNNIPTTLINTWISGHTHWSYNFNKYNINFIANQIGYKNEFSKTGFLPNKVFKV